ncbi:uncharacterized protein LOC106737429 [Alligator mississippiensis]|uniref:Apolipoprotein A-IV n=1 Tax=Alligator mississippiensis TaxID=8496 RepID=A0A151MSQ4_ALLMI|nr:uncharacterized protein LOC106737429 [Alligator mississippiensis]KYO27548.1 hypothetical protein Y1Q_0017756 [Alligator mississippiensis]
MELRAAVLALAVLGLAGSQAAPAGKGAAPRLRQLEEAINNIIKEVMQVTHDTAEWLKVSELVQELELQTRDLYDQLELGMSPELREAIHSTMRLVELPLWAMEPYLDTAMKQTAQALEHVEALGLDLPGALQAVTKWALELKEQLVGLPPISP